MAEQPREPTLEAGVLRRQSRGVESFEASFRTRSVSTEASALPVAGVGHRLSTSRARLRVDGIPWGR